MGLGPTTFLHKSEIILDLNILSLAKTNWIFIYYTSGPTYWKKSSRAATEPNLTLSSLETPSLT